MSLNMTNGMNPKKVERFGRLFGTIDFEVSNTLTNEQLQKTGRRSIVGEFKIGGHSFPITLEELDRLIETAESATSVINKGYRIGRFR